jgi:hypothetical protein
VTLDSWNDWLLLAHDFISNIPRWQSYEREPYLAGILPSETMYEVVRYFQYLGIGFEPGNDFPDFRSILPTIENVWRITQPTEFYPEHIHTILTGEQND